MNIQFISHLISNIGCSAIIAFFFIKIDKANIIIKSKAKSKKDIVALSFFFSLLSISGTYIGLNFNGAILNTRNMGVVAGGLLGGPYVAAITGLIAGTHRAIINLGRETAIPCAIATIIGGFLTAYVSRFAKNKDRMFFAFLLAFVVENLSMALILLIQKDKALAQSIVKNFYIPMVFMNSVGAAILILLVEDIIQKSELIAGNQAKLALEIANKTLPYFRNTENLNEVCKIIANSLGARATVITDTKEIIAGFSTDKSVINRSNIRSNNTREVLKFLSFPVISQILSNCLFSTIFNFSLKKLYSLKILCIISLILSIHSSQVSSFKSFSEIKITGYFPCSLIYSLLDIFKFSKSFLFSSLFFTSKKYLIIDIFNVFPNRRGLVKRVTGALFINNSSINNVLST